KAPNLKSVSTATWLFPLTKAFVSRAMEQRIKDLLHGSNCFASNLLKTLKSKVSLSFMLHRHLVTKCASKLPWHPAPQGDVLIPPGTTLAFACSRSLYFSFC